MAASARPEDCSVDYDFLVPPATLFGAGRSAELPAAVGRLGGRGWVVASRRGLEACGGWEPLSARFAAAGIDATVVAETAGEPTVDQVATALAALPLEGRATAVVVAIGGGAAIDLGKALAALATNVSDAEADPDTAVIDRLEGVGRMLPLTMPPLPVVAVPTTAGTGAEATRNAVISCPRRRFKKSLRSPLMVPRVAVIDPLLTLSCDRTTTAASGLDCITQLVESFVCRVRRPLPRALVQGTLPAALAALPRVLADPGDVAARSALAHAALVSGIALSNSGLGMAHGVAAALGVECGVPHGVACALMLPTAVRVNLAVCGADFATLERAVDPAASARDSVAAEAFAVRIAGVCAAAGIPGRLRDVGLAADRVSWLAEHSGGASLRGNPVELNPADLLRILEPLY